jgi:GNAT superfamily N-acetyltransferase
LEDEFAIRALRAEDIAPMAAAFAALGWNKPAEQYARYLAEQQTGERNVLVAFLAGQFVGYLTIVWKSHYPPFREAHIPEIVDFNVLPEFRCRGIGSRLMDAAEAQIAERSPIVGIGVGMTPDYGSAQRMYVKRGYVPDGRGLNYDGRFLRYGDTVTLDDTLALCFMKSLAP